MKEHPLTNEKSLEKWLTTISCNGCSFFINTKCTHEKAEENEKDKFDLVEFQLQKGDEFSVNWANNVNDYFLCDNYNSKIK